MIDPPRAYNPHKEGFGHYDKFHFTIDTSKYPNFPIDVVGFIVKQYNDKSKELNIQYKTFLIYYILIYSNKLTT
jgi:hypothetical protein